MTVSGRTLVATDLDQTLVYSRAAVERYDGVVEQHVAVERHDGRDVSWLTRPAAAVFADLTERADVVAVTTRTPEQWQRIRLPGRMPRFAITANGGALLVDGVEDPVWRASIARQLATVTPLAEVARHAAEVCRAVDPVRLRTAHDLFCYAVLREELLHLPDRQNGFVDDAARPGPIVELVAATSAWARARGWRVSLQGRKLYWVPASLTKSAAVAEVARRTGAGRVLAAGDSLLDADLLEHADRGIVARHGELVASGWRADHVQVTDRCGPDAGEEIVAWFAASLE